MDKKYDADKKNNTKNRYETERISRTNKKYSVAVVGATGLIGRKILATLHNRRFPISELRVFASGKSDGKTISFGGEKLTVEKLDENVRGEFDFAFFSAGKDVSLKYAPFFAKNGAIVIDNSSAFRADKDVPLVIPEINGASLREIPKKIVANPNCSTIIALVPLKNVIAKYGVKSLVFSTYQAVSGSGMKGISDLLLTRQGFTGKFYPYNISDTFIPQIGEILADGYAEEELKMVNETRKITGLNVKVSATCVRVPVENCHGVSVEVETEKPVNIRSLADEMNYSAALFSKLPNTTDADGKNEVLFGRIRKSGVFENGFSYFAAGDNTLKGAALNAVQIAEQIITH